MRTSFEIKFTAKDYSESKELAALHISKFLGIETFEVESKVAIELKVQLVEGKFEVTAHGQLKNGFVFTP
jgi:hypothetical protein